jgi:hypothetical protein
MLDTTINAETAEPAEKSTTKDTKDTKIQSRKDFSAPPQTLEPLTLLRERMKDLDEIDRTPCLRESIGPEIRVQMKGWDTVIIVRAGVAARVR